MHESPNRLAFRVHGMDCAEEVVVLKNALSRLLDVQRLGFDILSAKMTVDVDGTEVSVEMLKEAVAKTGLKLEVWQDVSESQESSFWERYDRTMLTGLSGVFGISGFMLHAATSGGFSAALGMGHGVEPTPIVVVAVYSVAILAGAWHVLPKAFHAIVGVRADMNLLMMLAVIGAMVIGEWFEAATVSFLFSVSLLLESWSVGKARRAIAALMKLAPPSARVLDSNGVERNVSPSEVPVGSTIFVRPAEQFPLDGVVISGTSDVNQAPITGESVPITKTPGAPVFAGTINGDGALRIESTRLATDTTLALIIRMVGEAQTRRAPSEVWVEKFARIYTPTVMATAVVVFLFPPIFFGGAWMEWFYRALVLLVIACPCALVISTPVTVVAALASAARNGVLIKGGTHIEAPASLRAIALDKTGTITEGSPSVIEVVPLSGHDKIELLARTAALEVHSNHPLARAISEAAESEGVIVPDCGDYQIIQGKGAVGKVEGKTYWLGSHRYLLERGQETPAIRAQLLSMQEEGHTVVVVGTDDHVCGLISLADMIRPNARTALKRLRAAGVGHLIMLTGDNQCTAERVAEDVGVDEVLAELSPEDKVDSIQSLVKKFGAVAMVGDGVNDAPALACATLGIAMGAAGSDAAIETADIALMADDLSKLPWLIRHSRRTLTVIRQNILFSLSVKGFFVLLTFLGGASLWAAIVADMGASLLVILNGLRLLHPAASQ